MRRHIIFDERNIKVALVHNDPVGDAFGVRAFHRIQVNNLLPSQLIPVSLVPVPTYDHHRYVRVTARSPATTVIMKNASDQTPSVNAPRRPITNCHTPPPPGTFKALPGNLGS